MSKAFTKEDVDPPERSGRSRSASGLPPGAANYITPGGVARLEQELAELRRAGQNRQERIAELKQILASVTVVDPPEEPGKEVGFGARVTVSDSENQLKTYRVLGVDELDSDPDAVSWITAVGRTLLDARVGDRVTLSETGPVKIVAIDYPS